jgi:hypothetical protein
MHQNNPPLFQSPTQKQLKSHFIVHSSIPSKSLNKYIYLYKSVISINIFNFTIKYYYKKLINKITTNFSYKNYTKITLNHL